MNYKSLLTNRYFNPCRYGVNQVGYGTAGTPNRDSNVLSQLQYMGCTTLRIGWQWSDLQPTNTTPFWSGPDGVLAACKKAGILPIFAIYSSPSWANGGLSVNGVPTSGSGTDTSWQAAYATYIGLWVTRYGHQAILEIWNEPNTNYSGSFWMENDSPTTLPKFAQYLSLFNAARTAAKAIDPKVVISVAGMAALSEWGDASGTPGITYLQSLMSNNIVADQFSGHAYTSGGVYDPSVDSYPTGNSFKDIARLQSAMISGGYGKMPLRIGEFGDYSAATAGSEAIKAGYVSAAYNLVESTYSVRVVGPGKAGVVSCCYFSLNNSTNGTIDTNDRGLWTGTPLVGPNTILASGTALRTFLTQQPLASLTIAGPSSVIATHSTSAYTVTGKDQYGNPVPIFPFGQTPTFASSDATKATIDPSTGIATGVAVGTANISASVGSITSNSVTLTVGAQVATASVVSPSPWSRTAGGSTVAFSVVVTDQGTPANPISSPSGAWSSSDPTDAPIDSGTGVLTPTNVASGVVVTFTPTGIPGAAGTSTGNIAAGGAPFLNSITISGPTTGVATHDTSAYTASGFDQYSAPFTFTPVWHTSDASKATINASSGVAHGGAAGTSSITATGSGVTSNAITLTIAAQVATTVTVSPSSFTIGSIGGTQALSAAVADQLGGPISSPSVSWGSSDVTKATVDSSGVVTDVAAGTATITATCGSASGTSAATLQSGGGAVGFDTTSYNASTGAGIGGSSGAAPMARCWDVANRWATDAAWRAQFASKASLGGRSNWIYSDVTKDGTGVYNINPALSAQYDDGIYIDLAQWQNSVQYGGQPVFLYTLVGANQASSVPVAHLATRLPAGTGEGWMWFRRQYQVNWTNVGDADSTNGGAAFNATQNASFKWGTFFSYATGRAGITTSSGSGHTANINIENNPGNTNGLPESFGGFNVTNEWTSGSWFDYVIRSRQLVGGNGHVWTGLTVWERAIGSAHFSRLSARLIGDTLSNAGTNIEEYLSTCENMNQSFKTNQVYYQWGSAGWDRAANSDPFGIEAYEAGLTPGTPLTNTLNHQTGGSITCNVQINLYTAALRPVVDGTPVLGQDFSIVSTVSEGGIVTPTVTGVSTGTHTIGWVAVNANNSATSVQSTTISVTV